MIIRKFSTLQRDKILDFRELLYSYKIRYDVEFNDSIIFYIY